MSYSCTTDSQQQTFAAYHSNHTTHTRHNVSIQGFSNIYNWETNRVSHSDLRHLPIPSRWESWQESKASTSQMQRCDQAKELISLALEIVHNDEVPTFEEM